MTTIDFSDVTDRVVEYAAGMTEAFGATLYVLHVEAPDPAFVGFEPGPQTVRNDVAESIKEHREQAHQMRDRLIERGLDAYALVIQGPTIEKIVEEADRLKADLIIMGSHGRGALHHLLLGSVSEGVIRDAPCPVLIVPSKAQLRTAGEV